MIIDKYLVVCFLHISLNSRSKPHLTVYWIVILVLDNHLVPVIPSFPNAEAVSAPDSLSLYSGTLFAFLKPFDLSTRFGTELKGFFLNETYCSFSFLNMCKDFSHPLALSFTHKLIHTHSLSFLAHTFIRRIRFGVSTLCYI